jgi:hypothetical protein
MIQNIGQLRVTMQQMQRLLRALEDLRENLLPQDPQLFATLCEAPLDDLGRLRSDVDNFVHDLQPTA